MPGHNRLSEESFGHPNQFFSHRTLRAGLSTASTTVLTRRNGTLDWYYSLTLERRALFDEAMRDPVRQRLLMDVQRKQRTEPRHRQLEIEQQRQPKPISALTGTRSSPAMLWNSPMCATQPSFRRHSVASRQSRNGLNL